MDIEYIERVLKLRQELVDDITFEIKKLKNWIECLKILWI